MPQLQFQLGNAADMQQTRGQAKEFRKGEPKGGHTIGNWQNKGTENRQTERDSEWTKLNSSDMFFM